MGAVTRLRKSPRRAPNLFSTVSAELRGRDDERGRSREKVMGLYACPRSEKRKKNSKADELLQQAKRDDSQFCKAITDLEESEFMDFGLSAEWFLSQLAANKGFQTFVIEACSANAFVIMAETGFFALTGDHYQMTLPSNLDMGRVKQAYLKLAETEDEECLCNPEWLLVAMPYSQTIQ